MMKQLTTRRLRAAQWLVYSCLLVFCLDLGGSLYEHVVVDPAWPDNPALIRPDQGGIDRKLFWIPIHSAITLLLAAAIWSTWRDVRARNRVLVAAGLYVAMRIWTLAYFVPLALQFEGPGEATLPPPMYAIAQQWVTASLFRLPLVVGAAVALWLAARRLDALWTSKRSGVAPARSQTAPAPGTGAPSPAQ